MKNPNFKNRVGLKKTYCELNYEGFGNLCYMAGDHLLGQY